MTSELQAAAAAIAEREKTINCTSLSASLSDVEYDIKALEAYANGLGDGCAKTVRAHIATLEAKVKKLREALEFYAKSNNVAEYGKPNTDGVWNHFQTLGGSGISVECGGVALAALAETAGE